MSEQLKGEIALVTGASRGIGAAIADELAAMGATVIGSATSDAGAAAIGERLAASGGAGRKLDVSSSADVEAVLDEIAKSFGAISILVNNAGITRDATLHKMSWEQWSEVIHTNLNSMFCMTRPVINGMRDRGYGRIINISSINGQKGQMGQSNYSASKAGVIGFTKAVAQENARKGITCNAICPGYIDTDMVAAVPEKVLESIIAQIPVGRLDKAEEIAAIVTFLASDGAAFMTGSVVTANGAQYIANG